LGLAAAAARASIYAHAHSSAPHSVALVLLRLGDDVGDFLLLTRGPGLILLGCAGAHPLLVCNDFNYGNSDGSGPPLVLTQADVDAGWAADDPAAAATDPADVGQLFAIVEKYFDAFCRDEFH